MSLTTPISLKMQVVVSTLNEEDCLTVQKQLLEFCPELSFSPVREQPSLVDCLEFYGTASIDQACKDVLIQNLDNDWDVEDDVYSAYGFNTKMFNPLVYYLLMEFSS